MGRKGGSIPLVCEREPNWLYQKDLKCNLTTLPPKNNEGIVGFKEPGSHRSFLLSDPNYMTIPKSKSNVGAERPKKDFLYPVTKSMGRNHN